MVSGDFVPEVFGSGAGFLLSLRRLVLHFRPLARGAVGVLDPVGHEVVEALCLGFQPWSLNLQIPFVFAFVQCRLVSWLLKVLCRCLFLLRGLFRGTGKGASPAFALQARSGGPQVQEVGHEALDFQLDDDAVRARQRWGPVSGPVEGVAALHASSAHGEDRRARIED